MALSVPGHVRQGVVDASRAAIRLVRTRSTVLSFHKVMPGPVAAEYQFGLRRKRVRSAGFSASGLLQVIRFAHLLQWPGI